MKRANLVSSLIVTLVVLLWGVPLPAGALVLDGYELFGGSFINMNPSNTITGNIYSGNNLNFNATVTGNVLVHGFFNGNGGSITGNLDVFNTINGSVPVSGTKTQNDNNPITGAPSLTLDSNAVVLAALASFRTITTFGSHTFTGVEPAGIYHVTGDVGFASGVVGNWTIVGDFNINGAPNVRITSFIPAGGLFPNGLAIYDAPGFINNLAGTFVGAVAAGNVENLNGVNLSAATAAPEPSTLLLLGTSLGIGCTIMARRRRRSC